MAITIANIDDDTEYVVTLSRSIMFANQIIRASATQTRLKGKVIKANRTPFVMRSPCRTQCKRHDDEAA